MFKPVDQKFDFTEMEKKWLKVWYEKGVVDQYLHKNDHQRDTFSFMDGPITANGYMAVHHAWGRTYKDLWQRYNNMKGKRQRFQNGFDNQGLWVEVDVEKTKGFKSKKDIEKYGIGKFVEDCKARTQKWAEIQTEQSKRLGYFMDWENSYYTMSEENNYMIWTFLHKCNENGWLYEGTDVLPWCPRCGTAISQHEILTGDYQDLEDDTIYFKLPIHGRKNEYLLVWTTTPWTLAANAAVAVHPRRIYVRVRNNGNILILSKETIGVLEGDYEILDEVMGEKLVDLTYDYPFKDFPAAKKQKPQYKVVPWDLVGEEEGTGIVHIAPGCGQEDHQLGKEMELSTIVPINDEGKFLEGFEFLSGKYAHDVAKEVFEFMTKAGCLYSVKKFTHRYPLCWRCSTKLLFRCVDEWYISMEELRWKMIEVAKKIKWIPGFGLDRELDWLENMHDWCISKKRYWGLALPIWKCKCGTFTVVKDEIDLKERASEGYDKFEGHTPHRPYIDEVKLKCEKCGGLMSRIPDVGNPWLDAGIVPFSTLKYRQDKNYWQQWYPADFITECFPGQFKNWFYSLIAMSTALENHEPFKNLLGHALVKDEKGSEMHKSKGNFIEFNEAADKAGVDVLRWVYCRHNPELDLWFGYTVCDEVRRSFYLTLWNSYKYLVTYANINNWKPSSKNIYKMKLKELDRWILSRLNHTLSSVDASLKEYDPVRSTQEIEKLVEDLSTWYIRRSRDRFVAKDEVAIEVLYFVLYNLTKVLMPFMPFISEEMWANLKGASDPEYACLVDYPEYSEKFIDQKLEDEMAVVRRIASLGLSARIAGKLKVRQPLSGIVVSGVKTISEKMAEILKSELNVMSIEVKKEIPVTPDYVSAEDTEMKVALDTKMTEELKSEGLWREFLRKVQQARKNGGLEVGEQVTLVLATDREDLHLLVSSREKELLAAVSVNKLEFVSADKAPKTTKGKISVTIE